MSNVLDFNKVKKNFLRVILPDEQRTEIKVLTPTKSLLTELTTMLPEGGETPTEDDINALYAFCARLMSRNREGLAVTGEQLADCLDFEDLMTFLDTYTTFVTGLTDSKN
jgi:hypothetical protein